MTKKKAKVVLVRGKKKTAVARVRVKEGKGQIRINGALLSNFMPEYAKSMIDEPIIIAEGVLGNVISSIDMRVNVRGGGQIGQAQACRTAIGKALVEWSGSEKLKRAYLDYDRSLLIDDVRKKESKKFLRKGARAKPIKSYR